MTSSFLLNFISNVRLAWPSLLCHNKESCSNTLRHESEAQGSEFKSTLYVFPNLLPSSIRSLVLAFLTVHLVVVNVTLFPLSQNWEMLSKLCFKPLTRYTLSMEWVGDLPILPIPTILPFLLSPNVTLPLLRAVSERNFDLSPVICLEQPLSRYQWLSPPDSPYKINIC